MKTTALQTALQIGACFACFTSLFGVFIALVTGMQGERPLNRTLAITTNLAFIAGGSLVAELCLTGESSMLHLVHLVGFALAIAVVVAVKGLCILESGVEAMSAGDKSESALAPTEKAVVEVDVEVV